jgi:deoxyribodipyrimidine photolyase-related protein
LTLMLKTLRLILGDQLNSNHSWFKEKNNSIIYTLMEIIPEATYTTHHIQKLLAFFNAMRDFAKMLSQNGHQVIYIKIDDLNNQQSFDKNINYLIDKFHIQKFEYQLPDEYRLDKQLKQYSKTLKIQFETFDSEHFLTSRYELKEFFDGKKSYLMESFYRHMRQKTGILMDGSKPVTGKWNYDQENRKKLPSKHKPPQPLSFKNDVSEIYTQIQEIKIPFIGNTDPANLIWPVNRKQSLELLDYFVQKLLIYFGTYQDSMDQNFWSIYHSRLSFSLNAKMIHPNEVISKIIAFSDKNPDISIGQVEGFIRQVIGWREYMRGVYWDQMPEYANTNFFNHSKKLPGFYWTGETKMKCVKNAVTQSLNYAYAHHIQRLMVTGNFALLAGIHPTEVDQWYLGIYIDAIQWVEITNTRGMSQFADGGLVATKPYVSSANYIRKMSNYCNSCYYNPLNKTGNKACPFNSLYWHFIDSYRSQLSNNARMKMIYNLWDNYNTAEKRSILRQAEYYLNTLEDL